MGLNDSFRMVSVSHRSTNFPTRSTTFPQFHRKPYPFIRNQYHNKSNTSTNCISQLFLLPLTSIFFSYVFHTKASKLNVQAATAHQNASAMLVRFRWKETSSVYKKHALWRTLKNITTCLASPITSLSLLVKPILDGSMRKHCNTMGVPSVRMRNYHVESKIKLNDYTDTDMMTKPTTKHTK